MGMSTRDRLVTSSSGPMALPRKCLLSPFFFFLVVIFLAEFGLIEGKDWEAGLCMVRGSRKDGYLCKRESISLSGILTGDRTRELFGVGDGTMSFPLDEAAIRWAGDNDLGDTEIVWEPTTKSVLSRGLGLITGGSSKGSGVGEQTKVPSFWASSWSVDSKGSVPWEAGEL